MSGNYRGRCFCGAVELEVTGAPIAMGFCHCTSCREWSGTPINSFTLWPPEALKITKGTDRIATYNKTEYSFRKFCKDCGGHLYADHPTFKLVDVYAGVLPGLAFAPAMHLHYGEKTLSLPDGLPKFKDLPGSFGGSDEKLPD